jgi:lactate racemase
MATIQTTLNIPYGKGDLPLAVDSDRIAAVLQPPAVASSGTTEQEIITAVLRNPHESPRLIELARKANRATIITSDHTRPVPSRITMPLLLAELRAGNPRMQICILVATGCHRRMTADEIRQRFGEDLCRNEEIVVHDCDDKNSLERLGTLPSGGELIVNRRAIETDLLIAEGFIEPHFFAGFSGGPKAVLPGIASRETVMANHSSTFINHPACRAGILEGNPIQTDMLHAAERCKLRFILNVALDQNKKVIAAFTGNAIAAHRTGCSWVASRSAVNKVFSPVCVASNGGYPLDQNLYQAVKGLTAAEATTSPGGVIIMANEGIDGSGGKRFQSLFAEDSSPADLLQKISRVPAGKTEPDQWQAQILARVLSRFKVVMVSDPKNRSAIESMFMTYAATLNDALEIADRMSGGGQRITVIPDGVGVIVR